MLVDNNLLYRYQSALLKNESFLLIASMVFFFIYPKDIVLQFSKASTFLRDRNDPDGNFKRFNLSPKFLNKQKTIKSRRQRRFMERFHIRNKVRVVNNGIGCNNPKFQLPQLKETLVKKLK